MSDENEKIVNAAKNFMRAYLAGGTPKFPSDFDRDILGFQLCDLSILITGTTVWNQTIFCRALGMLVETGEVSADRTKDGQWFYRSTGIRHVPVGS